MKHLTYILHSISTFIINMWKMVILSSDEQVMNVEVDYIAFGNKCMIGTSIKQMAKMDSNLQDYEYYVLLAFGFHTNFHK